MTDQEGIKLREILRQMAGRIQECRNHNRPIREDNTKQTLINPVLEALGWNIRDWKEVDYEFRPEPVDDPVDYALKVDNVPKLLVEAKALGSDLSDRKSVTQILKYAFTADVTWCVLTDGNEYRIYNAMASGKPEEKLLCRIRISEDDQEYAASRLALLSHSNLQGNQLESFWAEHYVDRQVRSVLHELLSGHDQGLVGLIKKRATKLKPKEIVESLCRLNITVDPPPTQSARSVTVAAAAAPPTGEETKGPKKPVDAAAGEVTLAEIITSGVPTAPCRLFREYKGRTLEATLLADGAVEFQGKRHKTCSAAGAAARATISGKEMATNGWAFWYFQDADGQATELRTARDRYVTGTPGPKRAD